MIINKLKNDIDKSKCGDKLAKAIVTWVINQENDFLKEIQNEYKEEFKVSDY